MILSEEIYGNIGTVYHRSRSEPKKLLSFLENNQWKSGSGAGNMYGSGLYTVFDIQSQNNFYGDYLYKFHIKGIKNFFIFLPEVYNHVWGTNYDEKQIIAEQNKRFGIKIDKYTDFIHSDSRLHSKVAGIIFHGNHDGDVCIIFDPTKVVPVAYQYDDEDWKKLSTSDNFRKNSFKFGGVIKDFNKEVKQEVDKYATGSWFALPKFDEPKAAEWYWGRKLKPNTSLQVINYIKYKSLKQSKSKEEALEDVVKTPQMERPNFNSNPIAIYSKNKEFICIVYFDGNDIECTLNNPPAKSFLRKNFDKEQKVKAKSQRKANKTTDYKFGKVDYWIPASELNISQPDLPCIKLSEVSCQKNIYDKTGGFITNQPRFIIKKKNKENCKMLCNEIGVKYEDFEQLFNTTSSIYFKVDTIANKIIDYNKDTTPIDFLKKILEKLKPYLAKYNKELLKLYQQGELDDYRDSYYAGNNTPSKSDQEKAKLEREKIERTAKGVYIGKHQYKDLSSVKTNYFNY